MSVCILYMLMYIAGICLYNCWQSNWWTEKKDKWMIREQLPRIASCMQNVYAWMIKLWTLSKWVFSCLNFFFSLPFRFFGNDFVVYSMHNAFSLHLMDAKPDIRGKRVKEKHTHTYKGKKRKPNTVQFSTHSLIEFVKNFINKTKIWLKSVKRGRSITRKEKKNCSPIFQYNFRQRKICNTSRAMAFLFKIFFAFSGFSLSHSNFTVYYTAYTRHTVYLHFITQCQRTS